MQTGVPLVTRAPARSYLVHHVWLLELLVIGCQIALSYADDTGVKKQLLTRGSGLPLQFPRR
jgi:hypothetical protein